MRFGIELPDDDRRGWAVEAERVGLGFVVVSAPAGAECAVAAGVAAVTDDVRIVVRVELGRENPVTLVEELHVLDNISSGRTVALFTGDEVAVERAVEELEICRLAGAQRPFAHDGAYWKLPGRLPEHAAPATMMVTPPPAQLVVPLWSEGPWPEVDGIVRVVDDVAQLSDGPVAPARTTLTGDLARDVDTTTALRDAGATHCLATLPDVDPSAALDQLVRRLAPAAAMVAFPDVLTDVEPPAAWPARTIEGSGS